jgi:hypothetical protein
MKRCLMFLALLTISTIVMAQENFRDTIFLENGARIPCKIIEQYQINHSIRVVLPTGGTLICSHYLAFKRFDDLNYIYQQGHTRNPSGMATASFLIPGLGQMMLGESSGVLFFAGWTICFGTMLAAGKPMFKAIFFTGPDDPNYHKTPILFLIGMAGGFSIRIWSAANASHLAKIHNSNLRERNRNTGSVSLLPYTGYASPLTGNATPVGLSIRINF